MEQFIGLDVSLKHTFISVREGGHIKIESAVKYLASMSQMR